MREIISEALKGSKGVGTHAPAPFLPVLIFVFRGSVWDFGWKGLRSEEFGGVELG